MKVTCACWGRDRGQKSSSLLIQSFATSETTPKFWRLLNKTGFPERPLNKRDFLFIILVRKSVYYHLLVIISFLSYMKSFETGLTLLCCFLAYFQFSLHLDNEIPVFKTIFHSDFLENLNRTGINIHQDTNS